MIKNRRRKDKTGEPIANTPKEINGFLSKREDFDVEYNNDAELMISDIEFYEDDTQADIDLKLKMLAIYNSELEERNKRKSYYKIT